MMGSHKACVVLNSLNTVQVMEIGFASIKVDSEKVGRLSYRDASRRL